MQVFGAECIGLRGCDDKRKLLIMEYQFWTQPAHMLATIPATGYNDRVRWLTNGGE
jgi:hypothetical protein